MRISVVLASMLACISTPAWAGWDYTEWDMSPDQVVAASDGQVDITPHDPKTVLMGNSQLAVGKSSFEGVTLNAAFYFDPETQMLRAIDLLPERQDCDAFSAALQTRFGAREMETSDFFLEDGAPRMLEGKQSWIDQENRTQFSYLEFRSSTKVMLLCKLLVEPI